MDFCRYQTKNYCGFYGPLSALEFADSTPTILRRRLPGNVSRQSRYTKSLSTSFLPRINYNFTTELKTNSSHLQNVLRPSTTVLERETAPKSKSYSRTSTQLPRWWKKESHFCTPEQLLEIIREPVGYYALPTDPYNEVYPGIYLSDGPTAMCTKLLKSLGITHVLNAAQGKERRAGQVNTWPGFYFYSEIKFLGVEAFDNIVFKLFVYFKEAAEFIEDALSGGGKVLVHCRAGISRSATLVCAFLMLKRGMSVQEAVRTVRKHRAIIPNDGFLQQLCDLNDQLQEKKH